MRKFLIKLFETREEPFDVTLYSVWHILYAVIIFAAIFCTAWYLRKKDASIKNYILNFVACAIVCLYRRFLYSATIS